MISAMRLIPLLLLLALLITGCQNHNPAYPLTRGTNYTVVLHQPLGIAPETARVFLQNGNIIEKSQLDEYQPHCGFQVRKLMPVEQTIHPEHFAVKRIQELMEEVVMLRPVQFASLQIVSMSIDASPSDIFRGYHFWFDSADQPDVMRMTCRGVLSEPWQAYPPTVDEITFALGDIASLKRE